jgi:acetoacetyl-CoA synthetase
LRVGTLVTFDAVRSFIASIGPRMIKVPPLSKMSIRESGCDTAQSDICTTLVPIWQRVLQVPSVGVSDNFFALGGNPQKVDLLFAEIKRECKRELPSTTIFHAPTLGALASVLQQPSLPTYPHFIRLKAGNRKPPVFIAPGLDGRASFSGLARQIQTEHAIYGLLAKGVDGLDDPQDRIEDMAEYYLDAITDLQSDGPYALIGYSFGGLVALEMAQQMWKRGKQVGLLVLVDAYPHPRFLSPGQRLQLGIQRSARRVTEIRRRSFPEAVSYVISGLERRLRRAGARNGDVASDASPLSLARTTSRVKDQSYIALARYRPRPYPGTIKFVKNERDTYFPADPIPVWAKLASGLQVETVAGSHLNMVSTHFENLAVVLTRYLQEEN